MAKVGSEFPVQKSNRWKDLYSKHKKKKAHDLRNGYAFQKKRRFSTSIFTIDASQLNEKKTVAPETSTSNTDDRTKKSDDEEVSKCAMGLGFVCIILVPMAIVILSVGMATPYWFDTGSGNLGLFQSCNTGTGSCESSTTFLNTMSSSVVSKWQAVMGLDIVGTSILTLCLIFLCVYFSKTQVTHMRICGGVILCLFLMLGAGCSVSAIILMTSIHMELGQMYVLEWSFYLSVSGAFLGFLSFCLFVTHVFLLALE